MYNHNKIHHSVEISNELKIEEKDAEKQQCNQVELSHKKEKRNTILPHRKIPGPTAKSRCVPPLPPLLAGHNPTNPDAQPPPQVYNVQLTPSHSILVSIFRCHH